MDLKQAKLDLPEYKEVLKAAGGYKPRKFVQRITIKQTPTPFNPSQLGDCAFAHSFLYDIQRKICVKGLCYSYDSMLGSGVSPTERQVVVPEGMRLWYVIFDGMWGGFWHTVNVYIAPK